MRAFKATPYNEQRLPDDALHSIQRRNSPAFQPSQSPTHFSRVRTAAIPFVRSGGRWRACSLGRSAGEEVSRKVVGLAAGEPVAAAVAGLEAACWERRASPTWGVEWCCAGQSFVEDEVSS